MIKMHASSYIWTNLEPGYLLNGVSFEQQIYSVSHKVEKQVFSVSSANMLKSTLFHKVQEFK